MKRAAVVVLVLMVLGMIAGGIRHATAAPARWRDGQAVQVLVGGSWVPAIAAVSAPAQARGLAGSLSGSMWFPARRPSRQWVWMRGMVRPLDVVWMVHGALVACRTLVPPAAGPSVLAFSTWARTDGFVELPAGYCRAHAKLTRAGSPVVVR